MKVTVDNVKECFEYYEGYVEEHKKKYYASVNYQDFISWCEDNLIECPACGMVVLKENVNQDLDGVCEDCVENGYYE
jgi:hypothetical protein